MLVKAAPGHVETVRVAGLRRALAREDVAALGRVAGHIVEAVEASRLRTRPGPDCLD